jgi:uncharacterized membrane protein
MKMLSVTIAVLLVCVGQVVSQSTAATTERQRYAILMAYMLKGSHNVRYETGIMQTLDQNG